MISAEKYDQLANYVLGALSPEEAEVVRQEIASDPTLAEVVDSIAIIEKSAMYSKLFEVETIAEKAYQQHERTVKLKKWGAVAAGLVVLGVITYLLVAPESIAVHPPSPQQKNVASPVENTSTSNETSPIKPVDHEVVIPTVSTAQKSTQSTPVVVVTPKDTLASSTKDNTSETAQIEVPAAAVKTINHPVVQQTEPLDAWNAPC